MNNLFENLFVDYELGHIWKYYKYGNVKCFGDGTTCKDGYEYYLIRINGKIQKLHRVIYSYYHGIPIEKLGILDHINRIRNDNRIENLREVSNSENCLNRGTRKDKHKNIHIDKSRNNSWKFQIKINGKQIQKRFKTIQEAISYRDRFYQDHPDILFGN